MSDHARNPAGAEPRFGTIGGVFTPCTLTILGVIMFLRFGYVVGRAGVLYALAIVVLSKLITLLTALSLSAIATNTKVRGGGAYFLISRSLGVEFGGAIGGIFYLAQAISVSMYVLGFTEAFVDSFPDVGASVRLVATVVNVLVFACVFVGAGWVISMQYAILGLLLLSLLSFGAGAFPQLGASTMGAELGPAFTANEGFFAMFALFFPAVTGIMAGANMSGDLKRPDRSIPNGTLGAIGFTAVVYLGLAVVLGMVRPRDELLNNRLVMADVSRWPVLITAGIFAATLSSALGSMMGAPRILQAFARDGIVRPLAFFARGSGQQGEPRRAIVLTFVISELCIILGDLDAVAPVITMAFLMTYGLLNLATFVESIAKNPSYRPRFRFSHWSTALLGTVGCGAVMFLISPLWATVAIALTAAIYYDLSRRELKARWGDVKHGMAFERARTSLLRLEEERYHTKSWRPKILTLGGGEHRLHLAVYGHWLTAGHGVLSLGQVIPGEVEDIVDRRAGQEEVLRRFIREAGLDAFPAVVAAPDLTEGIEFLVQCHGLGALSPNTVLLGWPDDPDRIEPFVATLRLVARLKRSVLVLRFPEDLEDPREPPSGSIDVWWRGHDNGALMLLLAHLLTRNPEWRSRPLRLLRVIDDEAGRDEVRGHLEHLIQSGRIAASPVVAVADDAIATIHRTSRDAALVFLGFDPQQADDESDYFTHMQRLVGPLPRVIVVHGAGGMALET